MGLQLPSGRTTSIELALRVGTADGARRRARALRLARHALPEETRARYAAQIALRRRVNRRGRCRHDSANHVANIVDGNDDAVDNDNDHGDNDAEHEDHRADGDRRHADGREDAAAGAPSARDWRGHDAQSTPGNGHQEEEVRDRADHSRTTFYREETIQYHRLHEES